MERQRAKRNAVAFRIKGIPFPFGRPDRDRGAQSAIKISLSARRNCSLETFGHERCRPKTASSRFKLIKEDEESKPLCAFCHEFTAS